MTMNDRATRIANLSPEQRRLLELRLQERACANPGQGIPALPRHLEGGQPAVFPLSYQQQAHWSAIEELGRPGGIGPYNVATAAVRLRGSLNVAALEASLNEICARHEALRTTFGTRDGERVQIVGPPRPVSLTQTDLRQLPPLAREAEAGRLLAAGEARRPFDLSRDVMLRATLVRLGDEEHVLLPVMHHFASDGYSEQLLHRELWILYQASRSGERASLPQLPVQYADYAVWQRRRAEALRRPIVEYWKKRLAGAPAMLDMPTDRPGPRPQLYENTWLELQLPASLSRELHALSRRHNVTLYVTLLAGWVAFLHRYSGQDDIVISTTFANRNWTEVEGLIGFFASVLPLRHDVGGDPSFAGLLGRARETSVDAFSHGEFQPEVFVLEELQANTSSTSTSIEPVGFTLERVLALAKS